MRDEGRAGQTWHCLCLEESRASRGPKHGLKLRRGFLPGWTMGSRVTEVKSRPWESLLRQETGCREPARPGDL